MTTIIGCVENGIIYMGGDSCVGSGYGYRTIRDRKVFKVGDFLIGSCGDVRLANILRHQIAQPPRADDVSDDEYVVCSFVEMVRRQCKDLGHSQIDGNQEQMGGSMLVGYRGRLYQVGADFAVLAVADPLFACGSGAMYALGAMAALRRLKPANRIRRALEISAEFAYGVRGPFYVEELA